VHAILCWPAASGQDQGLVCGCVYAAETGVLRLHHHPATCGLKAVLLYCNLSKMCTAAEVVATSGKYLLRCAAIPLFDRSRLDLVGTPRGLQVLLVVGVLSGAQHAKDPGLWTLLHMLASYGSSSASTTPGYKHPAADLNTAGPAHQVTTTMCCHASSSTHMCACTCSINVPCVAQLSRIAWYSATMHHGHHHHHHHVTH
jgi:hypothetical protein